MHCWKCKWQADVDYNGMVAHLETVHGLTKAEAIHELENDDDTQD